MKKQRFAVGIALAMVGMMALVGCGDDDENGGADASVIETPAATPVETPADIPTIPAEPDGDQSPEQSDQVQHESAPSSGGAASANLPSVIRSATVRGEPLSVDDAYPTPVTLDDVVEVVFDDEFADYFVFFCREDHYPICITSTWSLGSNFELELSDPFSSLPPSGHAGRVSWEPSDKPITMHVFEGSSFDFDASEELVTFYLRLTSGAGEAPNLGAAPGCPSGITLPAGIDPRACGPAITDAPAPPSMVELTGWDMMGWDGRFFESPSANIYCVFGSYEGNYTVSCGLDEREWSWRDLPCFGNSCPFEHQENKIVLTDGTFSFASFGDCSNRASCFGQEPFFAAQGQLLYWGGHNCLSEVTGMTCWHGGTGHGFRINRAGLLTW
ncbi:MAG: hypothetical protein FWD83_06305 [Promicromonosporaceae bacterium]|nr:hypothetical protein [Promicromonosporaceae bacterium]